MDALSDVLKSVRFESAVYLNGEFRAPWCIRGECTVPQVRSRLEGADYVMFFHFLIEGRCRARLLDGGESFALSSGDLVLVQGDHAHLLGSDLQMVPLDTEALVARDVCDPGVVHLRGGGAGAVARFVCGYLCCHRGVVRPLFDALPRALCIPVGDGPAAALLRELLREAVRESATSRPGAASMLAKLSELMFMEAMRRHVERLPPGGRGWLAGMRDAQVGRALALLHGDPARAWTVDELARGVALSRSALAERFASRVGEPPMQYLKRWRLALAAQSLRAGGEAIARVAQRSGYESDAAFSRAFKSEFGVSPAAWRTAAGRGTLDAEE